jgi:hypothetical protein
MWVAFAFLCLLFGFHKKEPGGKNAGGPSLFEPASDSCLARVLGV